MDYKKAYTEAKAAMRQRVDAGFIDEVYAREIFKDFENEGEIIKKELIAAFQNGVAYNSISKERAKDYISWIEKHKQTPQWMIDFFNEHRSHFGRPMDYDEHREVEGKLLCIQQWLEGNFVEQKIQPKFKVGDWIRYKTNPDDVERVDCVSDNHYILDIKGKCNTVLFTCQDLWELVEYKPTWSKEDDNCICKIINWLDVCKAYNQDSKSIKEISEHIQWLKSLRPQSQWKPSQEQIEALDFYLKDDIDKEGVFGKRIVELRNEIVKLI